MLKMVHSGLAGSSSSSQRRQQQKKVVAVVRPEERKESVKSDAARMQSRSSEKHYIWGKPMEGKRPLEKSRREGVYGCGWMWSKRCARWVGRSGRAKMELREAEVVAGMEAALAGRGPSRKRKETAARQREAMLSTVRSWKMKRGVPVRGQRTSTNGKTARRLNGKRGK